jgi:large exoprotein involved in heme utilization and adhesion
MIRIRSGRLSLNGAQIFADNYGSRASAGGVDLQADRLLMRGGAITSDTIGRGKAGTITINANALELHDGPAIQSRTFGSGNAGQVTAKADRMLISGGSVAGDLGLITSSAEAGSTGEAGPVTVTARELELRNGGTISSSTLLGSGDAGQVTVNADRLLVTGSQRGFNSLISSIADDSTGRAGTVIVTARELELRGGGQISSSTWGPGAAGQVTVNADRLLVTGSQGGFYNPDKGFSRD